MYAKPPNAKEIKARGVCKYLVEAYEEAINEATGKAVPNSRGTYETHG